MRIGDVTPEEREAAVEILRCAADIYQSGAATLPLTEAVHRLGYEMTDREVRIADDAVATLMDDECYSDLPSWEGFCMECLDAASILERGR